MYKILPQKFQFVLFAWFVIGGVLISLELSEFGFEIRLAAIPAISWVVFNLLLLRPVWQWFWKRIPMLEELIFPDLNGEWKVILKSNWTIQQQLTEYAASTEKSMDFLKCDKSDFVPLHTMELRAKIKQTWWKFEIQLWNPDQTGPIQESNTFIVEPYKRSDNQRPGICYFYKQINNETREITDDSEFYGAARLEYDLETKMLRGLVWTARSWHRAINTAGHAVFERVA